MRQLIQDMDKIINKTKAKREQAFKDGFLKGLVGSFIVIWFAMDTFEFNFNQKLLALILSPIIGYIIGTAQSGTIIKKEFNDNPNSYSNMLKDFLLRGKKPEFSSVEEEEMAQAYVAVVGNSAQVNVGRHTRANITDPRYTTFFNDRIMGRIHHLQAHPEEQQSRQQLQNILRRNG